MFLVAACCVAAGVFLFQKTDRIKGAMASTEPMPSMRGKGWERLNREVLNRAVFHTRSLLILWLVELFFLTSSP